MNDWGLMTGGAVLLYFGAEWFVAGASRLALALRIPQLLVGLTVVAYGTSAPEVIVGVQAAGAGHGRVALGNVIGSNIANLGLILGTAILIRPLAVDRGLRRRELPVLLASTAGIPLLLLDGAIRRVEGVFLILAALGYTTWMIASAAHSARERLAADRVDAAGAAADAAGGPRSGGALASLAVAGIGLAVLLLGGRLFVGGAVAVAGLLGLGDRVVGLTIVALGTSLPELVTSAIAARRGRPDIAVGNVVGSNIFNGLLCLGTAALAGAVECPWSAVRLDLFMLIAMTLCAAYLLAGPRTVSRTQGGLLLAGFVLFLVVTIRQG